MKKFAFLMCLAADTGGGGGSAKKVEESKKDPKETVTPPPVNPPTPPPPFELPPSAYAPSSDFGSSPTEAFGQPPEKSVLPDTQPTVVVPPDRKALDDSCVRL